MCACYKGMKHPKSLLTAQWLLSFPFYVMETRTDFRDDKPSLAFSAGPWWLSSPVLTLREPGTLFLYQLWGF